MMYSNSDNVEDFIINFCFMGTTRLLLNGATAQHGAAIRGRSRGFFFDFFIFFLNLILYLIGKA